MYGTNERAHTHIDRLLFEITHFVRRLQWKTLQRRQVKSKATNSSLTVGLFAGLRETPGNEGGRQARAATLDQLTPRWLIDGRHSPTRHSPVLDLQLPNSPCTERWRDCHGLARRVGGATYAAKAEVAVFGVREQMYCRPGLLCGVLCSRHRDVIDFITQKRSDPKRPVYDP